MVSGGDRKAARDEQRAGSGGERPPLYQIPLAPHYFPIVRPLTESQARLPLFEKESERIYTKLFYYFTFLAGTFVQSQRLRVGKVVCFFWPLFLVSTKLRGTYHLARTLQTDKHRTPDEQTSIIPLLHAETAGTKEISFIFAKSTPSLRYNLRSAPSKGVTAGTSCGEAPPGGLTFEQICHFGVPN